jgi:glycosyltransferase involved in cell wall biosynthesis
MKISGVIITFNEEKCIERCITSMLSVTDEILVVDSFSTDKTKEICEKLGVRFLENKFEGHIQQKNFAMSQAQNDWVLSLDADEELSVELINSITSIKQSGVGDAKGFWMNRRNNYCGKWLKFGGWYPDKKIRLWNRKHGSWKGNNPHDFVVLTEKKGEGKLKGDLLHYTYYTIQEHITQCEKFAEIGAKAALAKGKKTFLIMVYLKPILKFIESYIFKLGILDGKYGFYAAKYSAYEKWLRYKAIYYGNRKDDNLRKRYGY